MFYLSILWFSLFNSISLHHVLLLLLKICSGITKKSLSHHRNLFLEMIIASSLSVKVSLEHQQPRNPTAEEPQTEAVTVYQICHLAKYWRNQLSGLVNSIFQNPHMLGLKPKHHGSPLGCLEMLTQNLSVLEFMNVIGMSPQQVQTMHPIMCMNPYSAIWLV